MADEKEKKVDHYGFDLLQKVIEDIDKRITQVEANIQQIVEFINQSQQPAQPQPQQPPAQTTQQGGEWVKPVEQKKKNIFGI